MAVSTATPRAPVTPAQAPARGEWAWLATLAPPPPPVSVGGPRAEESERNTTPRGRREARGGGERERAAVSGVRVSGGLKEKSVKKERLVSSGNFTRRSNSASRRRDVKQRRRCGWDGVNSHRTVSDTTCQDSGGEKGASGRRQLEQISAQLEPIRGAASYGTPGEEPQRGLDRSARVESEPNGRHRARGDAPRQPERREEQRGEPRKTVTVAQKFPVCLHRFPASELEGEEEAERLTFLSTNNFVEFNPV